MNGSSGSYTLKNGNYKARVTVGKFGQMVVFMIGRKEVACRLCGSAPYAANKYAKAFVENMIVPDVAQLYTQTVGIFVVEHVAI